MSKHAPTSVVVVVVVVGVSVVAVTDVVLTVVDGVVVVGIGWHVQSPSQVAVAGHPEPSHCSPRPASICPSPQNERFACSV